MTSTCNNPMASQHPRRHRRAIVPAARRSSSDIGTAIDASGMDGGFSRMDFGPSTFD